MLSTAVILPLRRKISRKGNREWTRIGPPPQSDSTELAEVLRRDPAAAGRNNKRTAAPNSPG